MVEKEKWEYMTRLLWANVNNEGALDFIRMQWPGWEPQKYAPETMIPELNELGDEGWEMVHMQPIGGIGKNRDVGFIAGEGMARWSNSYFCVFKRRKL